MKILNVEARDVKGLKYISVDTNRAVTLIGGNNENGKSSFLDAIAMAIGGPKLFPKKPIREGATSAEISIRVDGGTEMLPWPATITRTIELDKDGESYTQKLEIISNGEPSPSPQTILNEVMMKGIGFDPLKFSSAPKNEQVSILKNLVGLDFDDIEKRRQEIYDTRTVVGRERDRLKARFQSMPYFPGAAAVDVASLMEELKVKQEANKSNDATRRQLESGKKMRERRADNLKRMQEMGKLKLDTIQLEIDELKKKLADSEKRYSELVISLQEDFNKFTVETGVLDNELTSLESLCPTLVDHDTQPLMEAISKSNEANEKVRTNADRERLEKEWSEKVEECERLTDEINLIDEEKSAAIKSAKWPIQGLEYSSSGVTLNGVPFDQLSMAQRIEASVAIGMELNKEFKFAIVKDGALLDNEHLLRLAELVTKAGGQVFVERVGEGSECHIVMENGREKPQVDIPEMDDVKKEPQQVTLF